MARRTRMTRLILAASIAGCGAALAQMPATIPAPPIAAQPLPGVAPMPAPPIAATAPAPTHDTMAGADPTAGMQGDLTAGAPSHPSPGGNPAEAAIYVPRPDSATGATEGVPPAPNEAPPPIAGLTPWQRPEGAPRLIAFPRTEPWFAIALHGVSEPYPASLGFLQDEGAWWTPFIHPGMTGPYDIRGWHQQN